MIDLKPEEKVEIKIGTWLMTYENKVFFNRRSKVFDKLIPNYKTFIIGGTRKKPDMIVFIPSLNQYVAIELKDASKSINIRKSSKILDYYNDYVNGNATYFINDVMIKITHFLVATDFSTDGHIFKEEELKDNRLSENQGKVFACQNHIIPYTEFIRTHEFIRQLWQDWTRIGRSKSCGIGLLLSGVLDEEDNCPAIFSEIYTNKWWQYWYKLK